MKKIANAKKIHLIGIKGVGMTAFACCLKDLNIKISGTDLKKEFITDAVLKENNITWQKGFDKKNINNQDFVIATGSDHGGPQNPEAQAAKRKNIPYLTHGEALGRLMSEKIGISVCGVGGKTTVSAMLATILEKGNFKPSYAVGVAKIFPLGNPGRWQKGKYFIAEADEYATSKNYDHRPRFSWQNPRYIIATNIEHDHPDIYPTLAKTNKTFLKFFQKIPSNGLLIINGDHINNKRVLNKFSGPYQTVGFQSHNNWQIKNIILTVEKTQFTLYKKDKKIGTINLSVPGHHNIFDAALAAVMAIQLNTPFKVIQEALKEFRGTRRRFEYIKTKNNLHFYDDYAHHPSQLKAVLRAARHWFNKNKKIIVIFQPHTFSRTKKFFNQFAASFSTADRIFLIPIYASEREKNKNNVSSQKLAQKIKTQPQMENRVSFVSNKTALIKMIKKVAHKEDIIFTIGAGDVWKLHRLF